MNPRVDLYPLDVIDPNPFQPRQREDPDHVRQIAASIQAHGLKQIPVGRELHTGHVVRVQLAAGMTRLAAFRLLLAETGKSEYAMLPVYIQQLTDAEMFETAVVENHDRKDLSPTELARSMKVYRDQFGKNSKQIGALYGYDDATVRNYMRLLDLPAPLQTQVDTGQISQATARKFLAAQNAAADPAKLLASAEAIARKAQEGQVSESDINTSIKTALQGTKSTVLMWEDWRSSPPRAGDYLWPLDDDWTISPGQQPQVKGDRLAKIYPGWSNDDQVKAAAQPYKSITALVDEALDINRHNPGAEHLAAALEIPLQMAAVIDTLNYPPACTRCPLYAVVNGNHFFGLRLCWENKKKHFVAGELAHLSQKLGIPVYDPAVDGEDYEIGAEYIHEYRQDDSGRERWGRWPTEFPAWLEKKAGHLRLKPKPSGYSQHDFTGSHTVALVSVRPELKGERERQRQEEAENQAKRDKTDENRLQERKNRAASEEFARAVAVPLFTPVFSGLRPGVLQVLYRSFTDDDGDEDLPADPAQAHDYRLDVEEHSVAAWCPDKNALQPPTQVHFSMQVKAYRWPFVVRFKSPDTLGHLIETLASYRRYVWPDCEPLELDKPLEPPKEGSE